MKFKVFLKQSVLPIFLAFLLLLSACGSKKNDKKPQKDEKPQNSQSENVSDSDETDITEEKDEFPEIKPDNKSPSKSDIKLDHKDADNDGKCDKCSVSVVVYFDIFSINDLHGKICDTETQPGVDEMTTYLKKARKKEDNMILISSGDMWQGSSESNLTEGALTTEWMNELDFEAMTLGNHEYDWGEEPIINNSQLAEFPLLAINVFSKSDNERVDYCASSVLLEKNGIRVGIIGAIGDCYSSIASDMTKGIYFKTGDELTELVKNESKKLKNQGAELIIYSLHDGYGKSKNVTSKVSDSEIASYYDTSLSKEGYVDIVFEGHSHQKYILTDSSGVYHIQSGGENSGISHAELAVNYITDTVSVTEARFISNALYSAEEDDEIIEKLLKKYEDKVSKGNEILGLNDTVRDGRIIKNLVAELYYKKGVEKWGSAYNIVLGGGFISLRSPGFLTGGEIKYSDLQTILPFDNELVLCSIKGADLKRKFFETDNSNYYIYFENYGQSVKNNLNSAATYYIVTDTYSSTYKPNNLTEIERFGEKIYARDLVADYIKAGNFSSSESGSVNDCTPISEILKIGKSLASDAKTQEVYFVKGKITEISNTTYGNLTISDGTNSLYVYGTYSSDGRVRFDSLPQKPSVGDTVILRGVIMNYKGSKVELYNSWLMEIE